MSQEAIADRLAVEATEELAAAPAPEGVLARELVVWYGGVFGFYLLAMALTWAVGIEGIYGSPMPFYALFSPVFLEAGAWHLVTVAVAVAGLGALALFWKRAGWGEGGPSGRATVWFVFGVVVFSFLFAASVAMLRGGVAGISDAYQRQSYEYIGDIGRTGSIQALFHDYAKIREYLTMHARVHPPGPIALLWLMSNQIGQDPLALSLATMAFGALGVVPLYLWCADVAGKRVAMICSALYAVMPTIALFTATSADILFMPFVLWTLFLFWRATKTKPLAYGLAAGVAYGLCSLLSFSLLSLGAFFAIAGLWLMFDRRRRWKVVFTAAAMVAGFLAVHAAVRWWSGFDIVACFHACKAQFGLDQALLDEATPRYPAWVFRLANPATWFYFAGIPVSLLLIWRLVRPEKDTRGLFLVFALTLAALNFLYLGRGEGERSAMYIMPFMAIPAAHLLDRLSGEGRRFAPVAATLGFMAFQCWFTESVFYTFW